MTWIRFLLLLVTLSGVEGGFSPVRAQDSSIFALPIQMDEVSISAARGGWDVGAFIRRVQNDTTFYKAFKSLRVVSWGAVNDIRIFDKKGRIQASLYSRTQQTAVKGCRSMKTSEEQVTGNFYKRNGDYNYFTAELYAYLFFTKGTVCGEHDVVAGAMSQRGKGQMEKAKFQLKQLIFNPGAKISGIPFIGNKASIFDPEVAKMYDFKLLSVEYAGDDCWLFRALPKKEYTDEVVYNELSTWFRKSDYSIMARDYSLSFRTMVYDFDVKMKVRCVPRAGRLLPTRIDYTGNWRVATKGRERAAFTTEFSY